MASGHNIETLKDLMDERDKRYNAVAGAQEKAVSAALAAAKEAVIKAEAAADRRFENTNEWRQTVNDLLRAQQGRGAGLAAGWGWAVAVVSLVLLASNFLNR